MKGKIKPEEFGLESTKAKDLTSGLTTVLAERAILERAYIDTLKLEISEDTLSIFRDLRLKILKNRTQGIENWRVNKKEFFLAGGKFIDATAKMYRDENSAWEAKLLEAENFFEIQEKNRLEALQAERVAQISPYLDDAEERDYSKFDEFEFEAILSLKIKKFEEAKKLKEKEKVEAEALRIAEEKRIEDLRLENERIKKEEEAKESKRKSRNLELKDYSSFIEDYNAMLDLDEKSYGEQLKLIKIKVKAHEQAEATKLKTQREEQKKLDAILAKQKAEADKLRETIRLRDLADRKKKEDEAKKIADAKKLAEEKAKAPIKEQLKLWVDEFSIEIPDNVLLNNDVALEIKRKFDGFKRWSLEQVNNI